MCLSVWMWYFTEHYGTMIRPSSRMNWVNFSLNLYLYFDLYIWIQYNFSVEKKQSSCYILWRKVVIYDAKIKTATSIHATEFLLHTLKERSSCYILRMKVLFIYDGKIKTATCIHATEFMLHALKQSLCYIFGRKVVI